MRCKKKRGFEKVVETVIVAVVAAAWAIAAGAGPAAASERPPSDSTAAGPLVAGVVLSDAFLVPSHASTGAWPVVSFGPRQRLFQQPHSHLFLGCHSRHFRHSPLGRQLQSFIRHSVLDV